MNTIQYTSGSGVGMGWLPDRPDIRDYTQETNGIASMVARTGVLKAQLFRRSTTFGLSVPLLWIRAR
ncbi:hypothetical protein [Streptomyces sp. ISL-100]|uniref:hypothetical protein n=1 Tax=Streptomyces sp. ISL-100 TaxID=2819173 RepID=UPI001BE857FC|nr:hypothetical protein [Streptomyces sp. ISL-100]MBT2397703.1 hypothetical protein [Streptomyces sp. ISL-100]